MPLPDLGLPPLPLGSERSRPDRFCGGGGWGGAEVEREGGGGGGGGRAGGGGKGKGEFGGGGRGGRGAWGVRAQGRHMGWLWALIRISTLSKYLVKARDNS